AEGEHTDAGHQDYGRTCVAHLGRIGQSMLRVVLAVLLAVGLERRVDERGELLCIALWIPVDVHGADLGADEVVGTAGAEVRELLRLLGVGELEHVWSVGKAADPALLAADRAAQVGKYLLGD